MGGGGRVMIPRTGNLYRVFLGYIWGLGFRV